MSFDVLVKRRMPRFLAAYLGIYAGIFRHGLLPGYSSGTIPRLST
jgi:hypothetical protein